MEKLILEWLERIDHHRARITLAVMPGWKKKFEDEISKRGLSIEVIEIPFEFTHQKLLRFKYFYAFFKSLRPNTIIFVQGLYNEFHLGDIIAAWIISKGSVFIHDNMMPPLPENKTSRTYFGFIKGFALWWHVQRSYINMRAFFCHDVIVVSQSIKERLVDLWGYPPNKVKISYHGVLPHKSKPSSQIRLQIRKELAIETTTPVIIVTARLTPLKCLDRLIEAFSKLAEDSKDVQLVIAGSGPLEAELMHLAKNKPCHERIRFLGHVKNVADYLQMADFYVLSSDSEGLSISLLEAMSAGLICISTNCPGSGEVIEDGQNGYLVDKSIDGVYKGLKQALSLSPEQKEQISQNARNTINCKFDINVNIKNVFDIMGIPACES